MKTISASKNSTFLSYVYFYMGLGLLITAAMSLLFFEVDAVSSLIYNINVNEDGETERTFSILGYVLLFAPLVLIFIKSAWANSKPVSWVMSMYVLICSLMGATLSSIFFVYEISDIYLSFGIASFTFIGMSIIGATTSTDLTKLGGFLYMTLWGLIVAMVVNMFMGSEMWDYIISCIAVFIFIGLTAYDTQRLVEMRYENIHDESTHKIAIMGAFSLYLNFINLFLHILRIFGMSSND